MLTGETVESAVDFALQAKQLVPPSSDDLKRQIDELKGQVVKRFEDHQMPYAHTHFHMVLSILQKAELLSRSRYRKRQLMAWYEMTKAELLHQSIAKILSAAVIC